MLVKWSHCDGPPWDQLQHFTLAVGVWAFIIVQCWAKITQFSLHFVSRCENGQWIFTFFSEVLTLLTTATECHSPAALWSTWWRKTKTRRGKFSWHRTTLFSVVWTGEKALCLSWTERSKPGGCEVELSEIVTMSAKLSTLAWLSASTGFNFLSLISPSINNGRLDSTRSLHGCKRYKSHVCGSCEWKIRNQNRVKSEKFFLPTSPNIIIFSPSAASYDDVWTFHLSNRATEPSFGAKFSAQFHLSLLFVWAEHVEYESFAENVLNFSND